MKRLKSSSLLFIFLFLAVASAYSTFAQSNDNSNQAKQTPLNKPLKIKKKPAASIGNCSESEGRARVRATFDKSGKVTEVIMVLTSGCYSFDKNVLSAAKKIKFEPEIKDGEPITVTKLVEYVFRKF